MIALAKCLWRRRPKGSQCSLREVADELAKAGYATGKGTPHNTAAVARMLKAVPKRA